MSSSTVFHHPYSSSSFITWTWRCPWNYPDMRHWYVVHVCLDVYPRTSSVARRIIHDIFVVPLSIGFRRVNLVRWEVWNQFKARLFLQTTISRWQIKCQRNKDHSEQTEWVSIRLYSMHLFTTCQNACKFDIFTFRSACYNASTLHAPKITSIKHDHALALMHTYNATIAEITIAHRKNKFTHYVKLRV